jgi:hypothetical protein
MGDGVEDQEQLVSVVGSERLLKARMSPNMEPVAVVESIYLRLLEEGLLNE